MLHILKWNKREYLGLAPQGFRWVPRKLGEGLSFTSLSAQYVASIPTLSGPGLWFLHMGTCPHRGMMSRDEGEGLTPTAFLCLRLTVLYCQAAWLLCEGNTLHTSANSLFPTQLDPCTITLEISQVTINTTISFPLHLGVLCVVCTSITKTEATFQRYRGLSRSAEETRILKSLRRNLLPRGKLPSLIVWPQEN